MKSSTRIQNIKYQGLDCNTTIDELVLKNAERKKICLNDEIQEYYDEVFKKIIENTSFNEKIFTEYFQNFLINDKEKSKSNSLKSRF